MGLSWATLEKAPVLFSVQPLFEPHGFVSPSCVPSCPQANTLAPLERHLTIVRDFAGNPGSNMVF